MGSLFADVLRVMLGIGVPFSWLAWAFVTALLLAVGPVFTQVSPRVIEPPARLLATDPNRVAMWMPLSILATFGVILFLTITIVGIPATVLVPVWVLLAGLVGYLAFARLVGERLLLQLGAPVGHPWLAAFVGIVAFRIVRAIPLIGAGLHSLIALVGYAATCAIAWRLAIAWHRRRMPDAEQFRGELLVEWYPDGDPEDGRPAVNTGRPVVGNVRGEEDRAGGTHPDDTDDTPRVD